MLLHNMSAPPRTEVRAEKRGIADRIVVFSLIYALTVRGFLRSASGRKNCRKERSLRPFRGVGCPAIAPRSGRAGHHQESFSPELEIQSIFK